MSRQMKYMAGAVTASRISQSGRREVSTWRQDFKNAPINVKLTIKAEGYGDQYLIAVRSGTTVNGRDVWLSETEDGPVEVIPTIWRHRGVH